MTRTLSERLFLDRPDRTAWWLIVLHVAAWTLVPWAVNDALPLDTIEALAWGREWRLGYDKHPPLSAWAAELAGVAAGRLDVGLYALSAACTGSGLLVMWRLARRLFGAPRALLALVLSEGVLYHHFTSPEFNVNVLQIPLWAAGMYAYWRGVRGGGLRWWLLLGVSAGLALLSKYLAGAMLIAMAVHALRYERGALKTAGPYVAAAVCGGLFAPHALWLAEHDFISLTYGVRRAGGGAHEWLDHVVHPLKFFAAQLAAVAALGWLVVVWKPTRRRDGEERAALAFVFVMTVGPIGALMALSAATGFELRSMWATPMLVAAGACAVAFVDVGFPRVKRVDGLVWSVVIVAAPMLAYAGTGALTMRFRDKPKRVNYPGAVLGAEVDRLWAERFEAPLVMVVGSEWEGGLVGWYAPSRPTVYLDASETRSPWANDDLARSTGAVIVWTKSTDAGSDPSSHAPMAFPGLDERLGPIEFLPDLVLAYPSAPDKGGVRFGVGVVAPVR